MEPNISSDNQSIDLTRVPPSYPGPSTSGLSTSNTLQDVTSDRMSNENPNTTEAQCNSDSNIQGTSRFRFLNNRSTY